MDKCTLETCPVETSIYGYRPSIPANVALLLLFSLSGAIHLSQLILWRNRLFSIPMVIGCICEILGYSGRLMLQSDPFNMDGFMLQICALTIAPAFFTASIYFCISGIVRLFGQESSRLRPALYAWIFIPCDLISLILQGTGGALASVATDNGHDPTPATNVMIAGLAFQVFSLLMFIVLLVEFVWRVRRRQSMWSKDDSSFSSIPVSTHRVYLFAVPFSIAILCIFTRCVYRVAELSSGWDGELIKEEGTFVALEGVMIVVAVWALNVAHPKLLGI
ncbi:hypothetical protein AJ80_09583 [Polytolypa hystricis UAMH7299]|uniref:Parasitic phase-specific protein PSP-1 n=1 Tax=Polytolypa hystricis (strain UAMH7299) TaxID=1447883 RepID=A0A2B7WNN4_POLH7|nr:hypothetical protein AJ80_09583 [Polytolypa hystricis UAMH7299]